jgi:NADH-quinone oxidoreductase subunit H
VTSLVTIGFMTGGWASNEKWSLLRGLRSAAQIASYEIPGAVAMASLVLMTGSMRLQDLILAQAGPGGSLLEAGGWPWYWYVFRNPVSFALFLLWLTTAIAEGHRAPLELPEAESDLAAGAERSGLRSLLFFFAEWANVFVMCGIASALFLGGWQLPGVSTSQEEAHVALQLLGALVFLAKSWGLIFLVVWIRWMLPRVRVDQLTSLCWKVFVPLSVVAMLLTAGWMLVHPERTVTLVVSVGTFATWLLLVGHFAMRVRVDRRQPKLAQLHLNPFL